MKIDSTPPPVRFDLVQPQNLHDVWDFVSAGLDTIVRKVHPDWRCEDIYSAVRNNAANLYLAMRGTRTLGFFVTYPQRRPFSNRLELFLWCAYTIPLRERLLDDNVPEVTALTMDFMHKQKQALGCDRIVMLSTRNGFERFGFKKSFTTWYV